MRKLLKQSDGMDITDEELSANTGAIRPICATARSLIHIPQSPARRRYRKVGEMIHVDTCGPYPGEPRYMRRTSAASWSQPCTVTQQITRIITNRAEEVLMAGTTPELLWPEALTHAAWLKNRSPTKSHKYEKTPFELFTGRKPCLAGERTWGTRACVIIPTEEAEAGRP